MIISLNSKCDFRHHIPLESCDPNRFIPLSGGAGIKLNNPKNRLHCVMEGVLQSWFAFWRGGNIFAIVVCKLNVGKALVQSWLAKPWSWRVFCNRGSQNHRLGSWIIAVEDISDLMKIDMALWSPYQSLGWVLSLNFRHFRHLGSCAAITCFTRTVAVTEQSSSYVKECS